MILLNHAELNSVALQSNTELIFKSLVLRFHADPAPQNINTYRYCGTVLNIKPNNSYLRKNIFPLHISNDLGHAKEFFKRAASFAGALVLLSPLECNRVATAAS